MNHDCLDPELGALIARYFSEDHRTLSEEQKERVEKALPFQCPGCNEKVNRSFSDFISNTPGIQEVLNKYNSGGTRGISR
jgi:hypothetical protein